MHHGSPLAAAGTVLGVGTSFVLFGVLAACGGAGGNSSDVPAEQFGRLTLRITDAPITAAERVVVQFNGLEIKARAAGQPEVFDFASPRQIDLLALDGGGSETLLADELLPAGEYEWIRLKVNAGRDASDSYVDLKDGSRHALFIPSGNQTGPKLIRGFTIGVGGTNDFTIDFDLRQSVIHPPGQAGDFVLKPVLRLVNNLLVGVIGGSVATSLVAADCVPAIYLFTGTGVTPDDLGSPTPPLASTAVRLDDVSGDYRFRLGFVPAGSYTVAFTCAADGDDAQLDDDIAFTAAADVTVQAGETVTLDLSAH